MLVRKRHPVRAKVNLSAQLSVVDIFVFFIKDTPQLGTDLRRSQPGVWNTARF